MRIRVVSSREEIVTLMPNETHVHLAFCQEMPEGCSNTDTKIILWDALDGYPILP